MTDTYDLIAIGGGPAGESAAELAAYFGFRAAIIERDRPGGTVTTTGGVPTKALREAVLYLAGVREGAFYGLKTTGTPEIVIDAIRKRTFTVCDLMQETTANNIAACGVDYIKGTARLDRDHNVTVQESDGRQRRLSAKAFLIATGSRPARPAHVSFEIPGVCDTDTILYRGRPPKDILIVGGGPVGVEFATICHAMEARVTIADRGTRLLTMMDGEIVEYLKGLFEQWGVTMLFNTTVERVTLKDGALEVGLTDGRILSHDTVLFAAGRVPNVEDLGLEAAGIAVDGHGRIVVDESFRTSAQGVYAAGDVLRPTLASIAMEQGRVATCHALGIPFEGTVDPSPVSAVYGMPEVSGAGLTEEQCRDRGLDFEVGSCRLDSTPRGAIAGRGGLLKLLFLKGDRRLLGVHCIGDIASEIVGIGQMAIRCGGTMNTIANMSMNTPTYSYAYKYAAFDGLRKLLSPQSAGRRDS